MSAPAFSWAIDQGRAHRLHPATRLVLMVLANFANGSCQAWPTQETLMDRTGLSERGVRSALRQLEAKGLLHKERRGKSWLYNIQRQGNGAAAPDAPEPAVNVGALHRTTPAMSAGINPQTPAVSAGMGGLTPELSAGVQCTTPATIAETPATSAGRTFKNPQEKYSAPSGAEEPAVAVSSPSPRDLLFTEGVRLLQGMLGVMDSGARNFLGKLLKAAKDDASLVLAKLRQAERDRPLDPAGWLVKACVPFRNAGLALIAQEGSSVRAAELEAAWQRLEARGAIGHA